MTGRKRAVILGEDRAHIAFVRDVLIGLGIEARDVHVVEPAAGRGAGEAYVRYKFPEEVKAISKRAARQKGLALIAVVDADTVGLLRRRRDLIEAASEEYREGDRLTAPAVVLVPQRNIETWLYALSGAAANEVDDYKAHVRREERRTDARSYRRSAANAFVACCRGGAAPDRPASLQDGVEQIRRALELLRA
jgi:hypothetical protein